MDDSLIARRPKRSTAGNRMQAALAEFRAEDIGMDVDEDADFALDKEEDDIFESDFESTDEEGAQEDVDAAAETLIRQEESRVRKTARTHLDRITALAHARQAATFNPISITPPAPDKSKGEKKLKRRVSLGIAVNAETGEVLEGCAEAVNGDISVVTVGGGKRHSTRTHTVANTSATVSRARDEVRKQSSTPKRAKTKIKAPTQAELIARALDMEEGNIEEHKNYLTLEEEKRKKARVVRASVQGPLIRWVSKREEITVLVQPPPPPTHTPAPPPSNPYVHYRYPPPSPSHGVSSPVNPNPYAYNGSHKPAALHPSQSLATSTSTQSAPFQQWPPLSTPPAHLQNPPVQPSPTPPAGVPTLSPTHTPTLAVTPTPAPAPYTALMPPPTTTVPPQPIERKETVSKQYVVHELEQVERASRPSWQNTMTAMFGDHADWENLRVYTTKGRPFARPTQMCPITGKVAKYLDPRTNVPYADLDAYRVLSKILRHEYIWSPSLECYVSKEGSVFS